jgi:pimeloyl-ACP methyl ester carboxylesterase
VALPGLVLVHGGAHAADCWELTVAEIARLAPSLPVLAVDLPGRRGKSGDLATVTVADWVGSVVADVNAAGMDEVVVVGHSLAGLTVPGVVAELGAARVRELVLATAFVPPEGSAVVDTLPGPGGLLARWGARRGKPARLPAVVGRLLFCNGMPRERRRFIERRLCAESPRVIAERVSRHDMPAEVPRTWIMTMRDHVLSRKAQHRSIAAIGGVDVIVEVDTCHDLMASAPEWLAALLVERCRRYATS